MPALPSSLDQKRALEALDAELYAQIGKRFDVAIANLYTPPSAVPKQAIIGGGPNLDAAVAAFDDGIVDMLALYARCREALVRRFPTT